MVFFSLKDSNRKYIIFYFCLKDTTPWCTIETNDFNKLLTKFKKLNCEVYRISKNDLNSRNKSRKKYQIKFKILTNDELKILKNYKCGLKKIMGREFMGVVRSAFLIDSKDKIVEFLKNIKVKDHTQNVLICFSI